MLLVALLLSNMSILHRDYARTMYSTVLYLTIQNIEYFVLKAEFINLY